MSRASRGKCQQKHSDAASLQDEMACPDCPLTRRKKRREMGSQGGDGFIHHVLWLYPCHW
jgi:hypothetical protein